DYAEAAGLLIRPAAAAAREPGRSDRPDSAEQLLEEALLAAERRRAPLGRRHVHHKLLARAFDRGDIAGLIETDMEDELLLHPRIAEGDLLGIARDIIPVVGRELTGEARPAEQLFDRCLVVDAGLDRTCQLRIDDRAFMGILRGAPGERRRPGKGHRNPEQR